MHAELIKNQAALHVHLWGPAQELLNIGSKLNFKANLGRPGTAENRITWQIRAEHASYVFKTIKMVRPLHQCAKITLAIMAHLRACTKDSLKILWWWWWWWRAGGDSLHTIDRPIATIVGKSGFVKGRRVATFSETKCELLGWRMRN